MQYPEKAPLHWRARRTCISAALAALSIFTSAACASGQGAVAEEGRDAAATNRAGLNGEARGRFIREQMTTAEKLGQLNQMAGGRQIALNSRINEAEYDRVRAGGVGSCLHVAGAEFLSELQRVAVEESRFGIPLLFAMDVVHGYRTMFPVPLVIAATFDPAARPRAAGDRRRDDPGCLIAWFPGSEAGPAIANVLFWLCLASRPANPDLSMDSARYMDNPITPAYAFGHGLSHESFEYGDLTVAGGALAPDGHVKISPALKNTKGIDADEVVQLYVRDPVAQVARPVQEMRGFARVGIPARETRQVSCTLKPEQFAYFARPAGSRQIPDGLICASDRPQMTSG